MLVCRWILHKCYRGLMSLIKTFLPLFKDVKIRGTSKTRDFVLDGKQQSNSDQCKLSWNFWIVRVDRSRDLSSYLNIGIPLKGAGWDGLSDLNPLNPTINIPATYKKYYFYQKRRFYIIWFGSYVNRLIFILH